MNNLIKLKQLQERSNGEKPEEGARKGDELTRHLYKILPGLISLIDAVEVQEWQHGEWCECGPCKALRVLRVKM